MTEKKLEHWPDKLMLDRSKWRCGTFYANGSGETELLNCHNYMCCLGQFAEQIGVPQGKLASRTTYQQLLWGETCPEGPMLLIAEGEGLLDGCIRINDGPYTTRQAREDALREYLQNLGIELEIVGEYSGSPASDL